MFQLPWFISENFNPPKAPRKESTPSQASRNDTIPPQAPRKVKSIRGRPNKLFESCSNRTKYRRVSSLAATYTPEERARAAKSAAPEGQKVTNFTLAEAYGSYIDLDLSERKFIRLRSAVNQIHPNCFASIYAIKQYKKH